MIKVLYVTSHDDYAALSFEDSNLTKEDIFKRTIEAGGRMELEHSEETIDANFIFEAKELEGEISPSFVDFMRHVQDYESSKHSNWYIIQ